MTSQGSEASHKLSHPFLRVTGRHGEPTDWMALWCPLMRDTWRNEHAKYRERFRIVGFTSFLDFPGTLDDPNSAAQRSVADAWAYCFRDPQSYFPPDTPVAFLPQSDFTSPTDVSPRRMETIELEGPTHDLVYVCLEQWRTYEVHRDVKGWNRAVAAIDRLHETLGLTTLIVGPDPDVCSPPAGATVVPQMEWLPLLAHMRRARLLLVASATDASPRVIAEALCLDRPVLVHRGILGGWHYVNEDTGAFFDDADDVVEAAQRCLAIERGPRAHFMTHHGPVVAGLKLAKLLRPLDPALARFDLLRLSSERHPEDAP